MSPEIATETPMVDHLNGLEECLEVSKRLTELAGLLDNGGVDYMPHVITVLYLVGEQITEAERHTKNLTACLRAM
jgi:hypothetical protein